MVRQYVNGRRIRFVRPIRYALLTWLMWFLGLSIQFTGENDKFVGYFLRFGQLGTLLTMPILAIVIHFLFKAKNVRYRDQVVLLIYWVGHCFLIRALITTGVLLVGLSEQNSNLIDVLAVSCYLAWALLRFHQGLASWLFLKVLIGVAAIHIISKGIFFLVAYLLSQLATS